jgi:hypothetical protein
MTTRIPLRDHLHAVLAHTQELIALERIITLQFGTMPEYVFRTDQHIDNREIVAATWRSADPQSLFQTFPPLAPLYLYRGRSEMIAPKAYYTDELRGEIAAATIYWDGLTVPSVWDAFGWWKRLPDGSRMYKPVAQAPVGNVLLCLDYLGTRAKLTLQAHVEIDPNYTVGVSCTLDQDDQDQFIPDETELFRTFGGKLVMQLDTKRYFAATL